MTFTNTSQKLMSYFFDIYENYDYNKTNYNQKTTDKLYKKFYRNLILSRSVYEKYNKHKVKKTVKEVHNIFDLPGIDLIDSKYIDSNISEYIKNKTMGILEVTFNVCGIQVNIVFGIFTKKNYADLKKYDHYIEKIFIYLNFLLGLIKNTKKPQSLTYYLFLTQLKKTLPKNRFTVLCPLQCNSGITYGCQNNGTILIYRQEEWFKVVIHETFHSLCLDFNSMHLEEINQKFKRELINVNSDLNLFESYTEFWATLLHSVYCAYTFTKDKVDEKSFLLYLDFILHYEKIFSLFQCVKVLDYMGLTYRNLIQGDEISKSLRNLHYKEDTNVFAYYVIKCVLIYYKEEFLLWCDKNNGNTIFNFKKTNNSLFSFLEFLKHHFRKDGLIEDTEKSLSFFNSFIKRYTYPLRNVLTKTMRMTIIDVD